jgi:glycosyltransferase involved in cell wall biosynthesis
VRIARVITRLNVGGPAIQAITLSERLSRAGYETLLIHGRLGPAEGDMRYLQSDPALATCYLDSLRRPVAPLHDIAAITKIYAALCRFKPMLVHTHMAKAGTLGRTAAYLYNRTVGRAKPARIVHTYHGHVLDGYFSDRRKLLEKYGIGRDPQYHVIPLGFDLEPFTRVDEAARARAREALDIPPGVPVVTTVGRLTAIKQHELFLHVAALVGARHPEVVFLIAGDGELRADLERTARERGVATRVRFLGWRRDLTTVYAATDVFVLTSRNEGTPVALIESMAAGVPGVSTDVGGVRDVITGPELGVVVPPDDAEAMAGEVSRLLTDADVRRLTGARARSWVVSQYGLDRLVTEVTTLYRRLLAT